MRQLKSLDGLRAVSILAVVGHHGGWPGFAAGARGVDLFFVISGFLITTLLLEEKRQQGKASLSRFYARRALRIFPAFYAFLAGYALLCLVVFRDLLPDLLPSLISSGTYTSNVAMGWYGRIPLTPHTWSLAMEEQFYLVVPWLINALPARRATALLGTTMAATAVWRFVLHIATHSESDWRWVYSPDTRLDAIVLGCLLAYLWASPRGRLALDRVLGGRRGLSLATGALALTLLCDSVPWLRRSFGYSLTAIACGALLVHVLRTADGRLARWFAKPVAVWVGKLSYSVYLWHLAALGLAGRAAGHVPVAFGGAARQVSYLVFTLVLASLSYYVVEKPFLRLKSRFAGASAVAVPRAKDRSRGQFRPHGE